MGKCFLRGMLGVIFGLRTNKDKYRDPSLRQDDDPQKRNVDVRDDDLENLQLRTVVVIML